MYDYIPDHPTAFPEHEYGETLADAWEIAPAGTACIEKCDGGWLAFTSVTDRDNWRATSVSNPAETIVTTTCPFCHVGREVSVPVAGLIKWQGGALIQDAFPNLNADDREALITGICSECFPTD